MENKPIPDAELAEVKRRHAAATPGTWRMFYGGEPLLIGSSGELVADMEYPRDAEAVTALHNSFGPLLARLEYAERERDTYHAALSDIYYRAIPMNEDSGHSTIAHIASDAMLGKNSNPLAARDAQQRREGAAEWFAEHRDYNLSAMEQMEKFTQAAKRLRERGE